MNGRWDGEGGSADISTLREDMQVSRGKMYRNAGALPDDGSRTCDRAATDSWYQIVFVKALVSARGSDLEIVGRDPEARSFAVQPRRWVVERSFAWLMRNRRLRIDYERKVQTSETLVAVAFIRLLLRRLARSTR